MCPSPHTSHVPSPCDVPPDAYAVQALPWKKLRGVVHMVHEHPDSPHSPKSSKSTHSGEEEVEGMAGLLEDPELDPYYLHQ